MQGWTAAHAPWREWSMREDQYTRSDAGAGPGGVPGDGPVEIAISAVVAPASAPVGRVESVPSEQLWPGAIEHHDVRGGRHVVRVRRRALRIEHERARELVLLHVRPHPLRRLVHGDGDADDAYTAGVLARRRLHLRLERPAVGEPGRPE